ncbi:DUF2851 family protein [Pedobacter mucosus]|uniref:DUF2851 family protein n=1 Tax=Pedobacter mucosus TaxID=2895286 RepID=UPI001EE4CA01|nr:DUF2851 family protein [Pedobacter mucosus]UKT66098.1 DUF2851 family protein [Pedobacter mucosus]
MNIPEDFLHYVWQFRLFDFKDLQTADGENLSVIHQGFLNRNAGPDFSNGKIKINETVWAGNIEIHVKSSDWLKHNHQLDESYENVILHVVFENDIPIKRIDGSVLPVLELQQRISKEFIMKYESLFLTLTDFPCIAQIKLIDKFIIDSFLSRTLIERFEQKTIVVIETLNKLNGNWDETFYQFIAKNFGFKVNALPFELFAKAIPQQIYAKHKDNPFQIEALVFGSAGFLAGQFEEEYPKKLKKEFQYLQKKYNIKCIEVSIWKFMRMRPQNFPTIRLAQFAALIVNANHLFSKILEIENVAELQALFKNLSINNYWKTHYHFKKVALNVNLQMGKTSINNILLNTIALFLFAYGKHINNEFYISRAIKLLESLPAENNAIITKYENAGVMIDNAFASQGILQLKKHYCDQKKCLYCGIGIKILKQV